MVQFGALYLFRDQRTTRLQVKTFHRGNQTRSSQFRGTYRRAFLSGEWQPQAAPNSPHVCDESVHHGFGVMRRRSQTQLLLAFRNRRVVNRLNVVAVIAQQHVRNHSTNLRIADLHTTIINTQPPHAINNNNFFHPILADLNWFCASQRGVCNLELMHIRKKKSLTLQIEKNLFFIITVWWLVSTNATNAIMLPQIDHSQQNVLLQLAQICMIPYFPTYETHFFFDFWSLKSRVRLMRVQISKISQKCDFLQ